MHADSGADERGRQAEGVSDGAWIDLLVVGIVGEGPGHAEVDVAGGAGGVGIDAVGEVGEVVRVGAELFGGRGGRGGVGVVVVIGHSGVGGVGVLDGGVAVVAGRVDAVGVAAQQTADARI